MPKVPVRLEPPLPDVLAVGLDAIRAELGIAEAFPPEIEAEAREAARRGPSIAAGADLREIPFVTIDPPGSRDLDQALHLERADGGFVVRYAIADVAAFVTPGGALDAEARRRGTTVYLPDGRAPLHPPVLSEGAASLLAGDERQALVWQITLDADGAVRPGGVRVERATVRSRRQYTYAEVQAAVDRGADDDPTLPLLRDVGSLLQAREAERGGIDLPLPEQLVSATAGGRYELAYRAPVPAESWNAQISLLAGMCAASLMLDGEVGVLRTLPAPSDDVVAGLRRRAVALAVPWPAGDGYHAFVATLDPRVPEHAAMVTQATRLLRGSGYTAFDGDVPDGDDAVHAAVAAPYAHVTAPLRRLVDRFANEVVLALCADREPATWARDALPDLPALMADARAREGAADRMAVDLVEAAVLSSRVGDVVRGVVVDVGDRGARVQVQHPAVVAPVDGAAGLALGDTVDLRVVSADPAARKVVLAPA